MIKVGYAIGDINKDEAYMKMDSLDDLKRFAEDGGWDGIEGLEDATGHTCGDFIDTWVFVVNNRAFFMLDSGIDKETVHGYDEYMEEYVHIGG